MNKNKIYFVDGMSLVFRAYHAMLTSGLKNNSGEPTGAIFGFVNILTSLMEKEAATQLLVVFDTEAPTFRHKIFDQYKANRDAFPEELAPQLVKIKRFISLAGIPQIESPGYEADDIIGTLAKRYSNDNYDVVCITSDKDYYQLIDDNIKLLKPGRRGEDFEMVSYEQVKDKFGVSPEQVIDVLALIGDASDNIPGVKGIGEKTAIPLISEFGSIEKLYENIDKIERASVKGKLIADKDNAFLAKQLVTIETNVPLVYTLEDFIAKQPDFQKLDEFFAEQGFNQIRERWRKKAASSDTPITTDINDIQSFDKDKTNYRRVTTDNLKETVDYLSKFDCLSFDLETDSLDRTNCEIVGVALSAKEGEAFYLPLETPKTQQNDFSSDSLFGASQKQIDSSGLIPFEKAMNMLKPLLENKSIGKIGQNVKFDTFIIKRFGINVSPIVFDTMVADYLLNPDERHNLDALSERWLSYKPIPISDLIGEKKSKQITMKQVDIDKIVDYACEDADLALRLKNVLSQELEKANMTKLATEMEFPLIEVLTEMEHYGAAIDTKSLADVSLLITKEIDLLQKEIFDLSGEVFNIDSPKQLSVVLFEKLQIKNAKKTKTGYSTDAQVLSDLSADYPIAGLILKYRQLVKLKSTYLEALPKLISTKTGKVHTTYNQTVAATGRLSSTEPNLQNIPIRTDTGKEIRKAFVASRKGNIIISADYSQIELRVMAHISKDENLTAAFAEGLDVHSATASVLFGVEIADVDSDMRRTAKTVNFGIIYGLGSFGLSQRLSIPRGEASDIITNYFAKYPAIKNYINQTIESTRERGYVETLCGRRRYFPEINSKNANIRTGAERAAINMPIQGTASDMIKIAMLRICNRLHNEKLHTRMFMQVHDELVFDGPHSEYEQATAIIREEMTAALPLGRVPIIVDINKGDNWLEAH